jgi:hypothetical protein
VHLSHHSGAQSPFFKRAVPDMTRLSKCLTTRTSTSKMHTGMIVVVLTWN